MPTSFAITISVLAFTVAFYLVSWVAVKWILRHMGMAFIFSAQQKELWRATLVIFYSSAILLYLFTNVGLAILMVLLLTPLLLAFQQMRILTHPGTHPVYHM